MFHPAIGFVAEVGFHVVPLTLVLLAVGRLAPFVAEERAPGIAVCVAAAAEPAFQVLLADDPSAGTTLHTAAHVFAVSAVQPEVFRRFDFVSMLVQRLAYDAVWHVGWGAIRLQVLF